MSNGTSEKILEQLDDDEDTDIEQAEMVPVNLNLPLMKEIVAGWLVEMFEYLAENPLFIVLYVREYVEHLMAVKMMNR